MVSRTILLSIPLVIGALSGCAPELPPQVVSSGNLPRNGSAEFVLIGQDGKPVECKDGKLNEADRGAHMGMMFDTIDTDKNGSISRAEFTAACLEFLRESQVEGRWTFWIAIDEDGTIVSNAYVYRIPKVPRPGRLRGQMGYVTNVYTRPERRGQGIGARLLGCMQAWARENGIERLILWPAEGRQNFYARLGFGRGEALEWADSD